jgi:hypothetical protein
MVHGSESCDEIAPSRCAIGNAILNTS